MRIAILGASSQLARDLIRFFLNDREHELLLFARRPALVSNWLKQIGEADTCQTFDISTFGNQYPVDTIINFVGVGDPTKTVTMGPLMLDATLQYDSVALKYVEHNPACRYIFLSSGAVYGSDFKEPATASTPASFPVNHIQPHNWYGVAKLHAECRHRALPHLPIIDVRVFNYFSHTQDMTAGFLMCEVVRALQSRSVLQTSAEAIERDYLCPEDYFQLISTILLAPPSNAPVDCYSKAPAAKFAILSAIRDKFGLDYKIVERSAGVNATGMKNKYYSVNRRASEFGYVPQFSSIDGLLNEVARFFEFGQKSTA